MIQLVVAVLSLIWIMVCKSLNGYFSFVATRAVLHTTVVVAVVFAVAVMLRWLLCHVSEINAPIHLWNKYNSWGSQSFLMVTPSLFGSTRTNEK